MSYFRDNIDAMAGYVPGEQPPPGAKVIKLNTNENPYPPSPAALMVLRELDGERLRRYPDPSSAAVCRAAAKVYGVPPDWVLAGNGSDELLAMLFRVCACPGRAVAYPTPTYVLYRTLAAMQDAECIEVPYDEDYNLPAGGLAAASAAMTIVASPNSPSGTVAPRSVLEELAGKLPGLLVVDEAYADFSDENALGLVEKHANLVVLRTLSKGYSLAGLRLGFAVSQKPLLDALAKVKDSYNVDAVACAVGAAAMEDQAWKIANAEKVKASREKLAAGLRRLGFAVWPSQSNFLLARPGDGEARRLYQALKQRGILVRYFQEPRLDDKLRISVGTEQDNAALIGELTKLTGPRPTSARQP
jgi:histidinol-phosphate aminotransferase